MSEKRSRRRVLCSIAAGASAGLAGCSLPFDSDDGQSAGCSSFGFTNTRIAPLSEVSVTPDREEFGHALLEVSLDRAELESSDAAVVNVYNPYDEVRNPRYTIPLAQQGEAITNDVREPGSGDTIVKTARIGAMPVSGEFRVVVEDSAGNEIAAERFSFGCDRST
jgi:hypothetical protein